MFRYKKGANIHKNRHHSNKNESLKSFSMECLDEEDPAFTKDGYFNNLSNDLIKLKFEESIGKENINFRKFIHHAHY